MNALKDYYFGSLSSLSYKEYLLVFDNCKAN